MNCLVNIKIIRDGMKRNGASILLSASEFEAMNESLKSIPFMEISDDRIHTYFKEDKSFITKSILDLLKNHSNAIDEVMKLGNPENVYGYSMAHFLASQGLYFPINVLLELPNFTDDNGITVAHSMANRGYNFSIEELVQIGNPADDNGTTVGHWMASNGYKFTQNDLSIIGDSMNNDGVRISDIVSLKNKDFYAK